MSDPSQAFCSLAVEARRLSKSFGRFRALERASFDLRRGEVHAVAGENGAGKSTLINILSGALAPDEGEILLGGEPVRLKSPAHAAQMGIATIYQELSLIGAMSVAENLFLGRRGPLFGLARRKSQSVEAAAILEGLGFAIDPDRPVLDLPIAEQQLVEIARALAAGSKVLLLDEPTSALSETEARALLSKIADLKGRGASILYISHRMEEIYAIADRITVLRDGAVVTTAAARDLPRDELVTKMVGRPVQSLSAKRSKEISQEIVLNVEHLRVLHKDQDPRHSSAASARHDVVDVSFSVRRGEIVGLAGLRGSGASQILHAAFGALGSRASGHIEIAGEPSSAEALSPVQSIRNGVTLLTNDRKATGLFMDLGAVENATIACLRRFTNGSWIRRADERSAATSTLDRLKLKAASVDAPVRGLSGGNQQKTYLARCLLPAPKLLLLDEPTRGVDIAAKAEIHDALQDLAKAGVSILLTASEMDELLLLCDRILVLHRGRITAELDRRRASRAAILSAAMGHQDQGFAS